MKIYMVIADNNEKYPEDHAHWNVDAFSSKEAAEDYINKLPDLIKKGLDLIDRFDKIWCVRELTDEEREERSKLKEKWSDYWGFLKRGGYFHIKEYEVLDKIES